MIGGGAVYAAFLPHADRLVVTEVDLAGRRRHLGARRSGPGVAADRTGRRPTGWGDVRRPDSATRVQRVRRAVAVGPRSSRFSS